MLWLKINYNNKHAVRGNQNMKQQATLNKIVEIKSNVNVC